jgi:large subunit ribosomal protein L25
MADATLIAERRPARGKRPAGRIRRDGLVPAVVYGLGAENVPVSVSQRELVHILSGGSGMNTLITLDIDGTRELAIARELQRHPVRGNVIHVDFVRVRADQTIQSRPRSPSTSPAKPKARCAAASSNSSCTR